MWSSKSGWKKKGQGWDKKGRFSLWELSISWQRELTVRGEREWEREREPTTKTERHRPTQRNTETERQSQRHQDRERQRTMEAVRHRETQRDRGPYLVEVSKSHPLYGRCFPLRQRGNKLHSRRLLLQHPQRQSAEHSVTLVDEGLCRGASVHCYHFTACRSKWMKTE